MKSAFAIMACNRPDYFARCLDGVSRIVERPDTFVFLDYGNRDSEMKSICSRYPLLHLIAQKKNLGIGKHVLFIRDLLFENYDQIQLIEDDMIPSRFLWVHSRNALAWCQTNGVPAGLVSTDPHCLLSREKKLERIGNIHFSVCLLGYIMPKSTWILTRPMFAEHCKLFLENVDYLHRPHQSIVHWIKEQLRDSPEFCLNYPKEFQVPLSKVIPMIVSSQDSVDWASMRLFGLHPGTCFVNRILYIGEHGVHGTSEWFRSNGYDRIHLDEFEQDVELEDFQLLPYGWNEPKPGLVIPGKQA